MSPKYPLTYPRRAANRIQEKFKEKQNSQLNFYKSEVKKRKP